MDKRDFIWESIDELSDADFQKLCTEYIEYVGIDIIVDCILERGYDFCTGILNKYEEKPLGFTFELNQWENLKLDMACGK